MNRRILLVITTGAFLVINTMVLFGQEGGGKAHPTLASLDASRCTTCHADIADKKHVHSPVTESGCDACHEMTKENGKVTVALAAEGNDLCFSCHDDIEARAKKKHPHDALDEGCGLCHNPHSAEHPRLLVSGMNTLCAECHDLEEDDFKKRHGYQPVARRGCGGCHDAHGSDQDKLLKGNHQHVPFQEGQCVACHKRARGKLIRLRGNGADLCYACHSDKQGEFKKQSVHTPVERGDCIGCHDPHLSNQKMLLKQTGNRLCLSCHAGISALLKAKHPHPPAEESCLDCHSPHAADNRFVLSDKPVNICLNCHDGEDSAFKSKHYNQKPEGLRCSECHNPHGSPNKTLINTTAHAPFLEGECDTCHDGLSEENKIQLNEDSIAALCINCHDDKDAGGNKGMIQHGALDVDDCTACHSAHASSRAAVLKDHTLRLCASCHEEKKKGGANRVMHGIIDTVGCEACHQSHFSKNKKLLVKTGNALCLACHVDRSGIRSTAKKNDEIPVLGKLNMTIADWLSIKKISLSSDQTRGHPQGGHIVRGEVTAESLKNKRLRKLTFRGILNCLSCHDAHAGATAQLFADGIAGRFQLCIKCHSK